MKKQVLIIANSHDEFKNWAQPYFDTGYLMVPESLRLVADGGHAVLAIIMEKEIFSAEPPAPSGT